MVLETPELTKAVEEQTDAARETRETFASLQEKIDKEQAERTKKVDEFIRALDDDRRQMAEDMRARDDEFMDKLYSNVVRQGSASAQQSSFDRLVESYEGPSTADRVMQGAGTAAEVAQGATSVIGALGAGGTRGMGTIANVLSKAGGVLKFLGPWARCSAPPLRASTSWRAASTVPRSEERLVGGDRAAPATSTSAWSRASSRSSRSSRPNLSDKDVQTIQQGLMSGGATYGSETYGQGYDWVVNADAGARPVRIEGDRRVREGRREGRQERRLPEREVRHARAGGGEHGRVPVVHTGAAGGLREDHGGAYRLVGRGAGGRR